MNRHQRTLRDQPPAHLGRRSRRTPGMERGATLVEYTLMLSLILLVALAGLSGFGSSLGENVDDSSSRLVTAYGG